MGWAARLEAHKVAGAGPEVALVGEKIVDLVGVAFEPAERFDRLERRMDGFDKRMDGFDQRMDGFDQRMERLESTVDKGFAEMRAKFDQTAAGMQLIVDLLTPGPSET